MAIVDKSSQSETVTKDKETGVTAIELLGYNPETKALERLISIDGYLKIGSTDPVSNLPVFVDYVHHQVHEGETYIAQSVQAIDTSTVKYGLTVPEYTNTIQAPHMEIIGDVYNGTVRIDLYETATFTGGSDLTAVNRNRNSTNTAKATIKGGVTSTNGTLIKSFYAGTGRGQSGLSRSDTEMILKSNTIYRVDVIGQTAGTAVIVRFLWYEDLGV